jgi:histidinol-phosphate/aromatic aminotransferase/cobyric acid decarboxylase-like protein
MTMNIYDYAEQKKISIRQVLDFTLLSNPIGPSNKARSAMRSALKAAALFPDRETRYLRRCIAKKERLEPENILFGHGSELLLELVFTCVKPGKVLIPGPLPTHYLPILERHEARAISCSLHASEDPSREARRLAPLVGEADMLLFPNPHWMTGDPPPIEVVRRMTEGLRGSNKILLLDEGLVEFAGGAYSAEEAVRSENMLVLRTFSFYHALAGLRLGYALGNPRVLDRVAGTINMGPVNAVAAAGAVASLKDEELQRRTAEFLKTEKAYLMDKLGRIKGVQAADTSCNFLLVSLTTDTADTEKELLRRSILVDRFTGEDGGQFLRVAVRGHRQNARFAKTLARIVFQSKSGR